MIGFCGPVHRGGARAMLTRCHSTLLFNLVSTRSAASSSIPVPESHLRNHDLFHVATMSRRHAILARGLRILQHYAVDWYFCFTSCKEYSFNSSSQGADDIYHVNFPSIVALFSNSDQGLHKFLPGALSKCPRFRSNRHVDSIIFQSQRSFSGTVEAGVALVLC
jgi:hypothetical protein